MNGTATESTLQELLSLHKAGDIGTDFLGGSGSVSGETGFPKGQYAMYIDGPWAVPTYRQDHFSDYGMTLFPKGAGGSVSTVGGEDLVVANDVQHQADVDQTGPVPDRAPSPSSRWPTRATWPPTSRTPPPR